MSDSRLSWLTSFTRELMRYDDTSAVLDRILLEARKASCADAGTVFLVEGDSLIFAYTHNDTLFSVETAYKYAYADARLPITSQSIAGACAVSRQPIRLDDVRHLPEGVPFRFNDSFDRATGYRTVSVLGIPLLGREGRPLGVIQLINSKGPDGSPQPFTEEMENFLVFFSVQAVSALERSLLTREMVHRMQKMAALNDPKETGPHAERVGAIAAEIYQRWAEKCAIPVDARRSFRSNIRLAAMLHDLGKVAIPHNVLKKPGRLTLDEFEIIKTHCAEGAKLFKTASLDVDSMSRDIAQHHHQKWNGTGYTGDPDVPILAGEEIPLAARITAVADVFDALVSARCYKPAWTWEEAVTEIRKSAGSHFDPAVVDAFLEVEDTVRNIFERYPDIESSH